jgi:hypothetical protein
MTTRTIGAYSCLMHIAVAIVTSGFCFREYQCSMTLPAIDFRMLPYQGQLCSTVVKRVNLFIELPTFCTVASLAADLEIGSVRRVGLPGKRYQQNNENQE